MAEYVILSIDEERNANFKSGVSVFSKTQNIAVHFNIGDSNLKQSKIINEDAIVYPGTVLIVYSLLNHGGTATRYTNTSGKKIQIIGKSIDVVADTFSTFITFSNIIYFILFIVMVYVLAAYFKFSPRVGASELSIYDD